jgi:hypothetical protein
MYSNFLSENLKSVWVDLGVDGRIILIVMYKLSVRLLTGFSWLMIRSVVGVLQTRK